MSNSFVAITRTTTWFPSVKEYGLEVRVERLIKQSVRRGLVPGQSALDEKKPLACHT